MFCWVGASLEASGDISEPSQAEVAMRAAEHELSFAGREENSRRFLVREAHIQQVSAFNLPSCHVSVSRHHTVDG